MRVILGPDDVSDTCENSLLQVSFSIGFSGSNGFENGLLRPKVVVTQRTSGFV